jgi:hypothetical protein
MEWKITILTSDCPRFSGVTKRVGSDYLSYFKDGLRRPPRLNSFFRSSPGISSLGERELPRITNLIMMHARIYQDNRSEQDPTLSFPWLDALDRTMSSRDTAWPPQFLTSYNPSEDNFMSLSIQYGLFDYVQGKLRRDPSMLSGNPGKPLLSYAVHLSDVTSPTFVPVRHWSCIARSFSTQRLSILC